MHGAYRKRKSSAAFTGLGVLKQFFLFFISLSFMGSFAGPLGAKEPATTEDSPETPSTFVSFLEKRLLNLPATTDIQVGDMDGDGAVDLIFTTSDPGVFWVSRGNANGKFLLLQRHRLGKDYGLSDIILTVYNPYWGLEGRVLVNISQRL